MAAITQLIDETTGGPLRFIHGDPHVIEIIDDTEDLSGFTYRADIRQSRRSDEVLVSWTTSVSYDPDEEESMITLSMDGDSAAGAFDGDSRKIPTRTAVMDIQELDTNGVPTRTYAQAEVIGQLDVTR